jgi:hypothetical protein
VSPWRRPRAVGVAALCALLLGACTKASPSAPAVPRPAPTRAVTIASVDPNFDFGQTVFITTRGYRPAWLVSVVQVPVTFRNTTDRPQLVVFNHSAVRSGLIPPGGVFRYTPPNAVSVTYHGGRGHRAVGRIQVTPAGAP